MPFSALGNGMNGGPIDRIFPWEIDVVRSCTYTWCKSMDNCFLNLIFAGKACFMNKGAQGSHGICGDPSANTAKPVHHEEHRIVHSKRRFNCYKQLSYPANPQSQCPIRKSAKATI
jgi:hypothetical protein